MARYDYQCTACEKEVEKEHKISETPQYKCEFCGAEPLKRLLGASQFRLAGHRWAGDGYSGFAPYFRYKGEK